MHNRRNGVAAGVGVLLITSASLVQAQEKRLTPRTGRNAAGQIKPATAKDRDESTGTRGIPSKESPSGNSASGANQKEGISSDAAARTRLESPKSAESDARSVVVQEPS